MSSVTLTPPPLPADVPLVAQPTEYEGFIDQRLRQTRRQVKTVDVAGGLATLALGAMLYLLVAALADHWLIVGGWGDWGRWLLWLALVGGAGTYFIFRLLPPLVHRVNPVFAASTIEKSQPSLRNSLINFLLLRGRRRELAAPVYNALEQRAAADLSKVRVETAVDRTQLLRLCIALAVVLALFSLYLVFSPKNPLRSAARILFPWSNVTAPTRVTIDGVRPGDTAAFHGEFIAVSAEFTGLGDGETPLLIYSTADGQSVDQAVPMTVPKGSSRYECRIPPGNVGLQQDYKYRLAAGDCRTPGYLIKVQNAPAIAVEKVVYHYPEYTGLADETLENRPDLRAIEGTEVTIHAAANVEIKPGTAEIDLGCTGRPGVRMTDRGFKATGGFTLRLNAADNAPEFDCYQLRFSDLQGRANLRPVRHTIEVLRDLPPDVRVLEPKENNAQVAENGKLTIRVRAEDPDFALRRVVLRIVNGDDNRSLSIAPLLDKRLPEKGFQGEFLAEYSFEPAKLKLMAGDRVQYWVEAEDNKEPAANRSETEKRWIDVAAPEVQDKRRRQDGAKGKDSEQPGKTQGPSDERRDRPENADRPPEDQPPEDQAAEDPAEKQQTKDKSKSPQADRNEPGQKETSGEKQDGEKDSQAGDKRQGDDKSGAGKQGDNRQDEGKQGDKQQGGGEQDGRSADQSDRRTDPNAEPGDAMQKILEDLQRQQKNERQQDKPQTDNQQTGARQDEKQQQTGDKQQADNRPKSGDQNRPDQQQPGEKRPQIADQGAGKEQSADKKQEDKSGAQGAGKEQSGTDQPPGAKSEQKQDGSEQGEGKESAAGEDTTDKTDGKEQPTAADKSDAAKGEGQQTEKSQKDGEKGAREKPGEKMNGGEKSGGKSGDDQPQPNDGEQAGDKQPGEKQPGQKDAPGAERKPDDGSGSPMPQEQARPDNKQRPDQPGQAPGERKENEVQSPAQGKHESDAKGDTAGDRHGEGEKGGGQQSDQSGVGGPGSHTPADKGASQADERGRGETGSRPGDAQKSDEPTGSMQKTPGKGQSQTPDSAGQKAVPDGTPPDIQRQTDSPDAGQNGKPPDTPGKGGLPTDTAKDSQGRPALSAGGNAGKSPSEKSPGTDGAGEADSANLDYARRQTELALEYLRDQLAKEKPELLDRLGWSKEEARQFLARWEEMRRAANEKGPAGETAKKQYDEALKSLGFTPRGTELKHGGVEETEKSEIQRDTGRYAPPPEWADQLRAYTRGISGQKKGDSHQN